LAAGSQQSRAAAQQFVGVTANADVAVGEQRGHPPALARQRLEHRTVDGACPGPLHPGHGNTGDVHAKHGDPALRQRDGQAAGAATDVEYWRPASAQQLLVGHVGRPAPAGYL